MFALPSIMVAPTGARHSIADQLAHSITVAPIVIETRKRFVGDVQTIEYGGRAGFGFATSPLKSKPSRARPTATCVEASVRVITVGKVA